jgi:hypothetical protein
MGIATASVKAWEDGITHPKMKERAFLVKHSGFALSNVTNHAHKSLPMNLKVEIATKARTMRCPFVTGK